MMSAPEAAFAALMASRRVQPPAVVAHTPSVPSAVVLTTNVAPHTVAAKVMDQPIARAVATRAHPVARRARNDARGLGALVCVSIGGRRKSRIDTYESARSTRRLASITGHICGNFRACDMMLASASTTRRSPARAERTTPTARVRCAAVSSIPLFGPRASSRNPTAPAWLTESSVDMSAAFAAGPAVLRFAMVHPRCVLSRRSLGLAGRHGWCGASDARSARPTPADRHGLAAVASGWMRSHTRTASGRHGCGTVGPGNSRRSRHWSVGTSRASGMHSKQP